MFGARPNTALSAKAPYLPRYVAFGESALPATLCGLWRKRRTCRAMWPSAKAPYLSRYVAASIVAQLLGFWVGTVCQTIHAAAS